MNLSLSLSVVATLVSAASLSVAVLSYRRGGTQLQVRLSYEVVAGPADNLERNYLVRVLNERPATVQVWGVKFQFKGQSDHFLVGPLVGDLPQTLDGYHSGEWRADASMINVKQTHEPYVRAVITFGSGQESESNWIKVGPPERMIETALGALSDARVTDSANASEVTVRIEA